MLCITARGADGAARGKPSCREYRITRLGSEARSMARVGPLTTTAAPRKIKNQRSAALRLRYYKEASRVHHGARESPSSSSVRVSSQGLVCSKALNDPTMGGLKLAGSFLNSSLVRKSRTAPNLPHAHLPQTTAHCTSTESHLTTTVEMKNRDCKSRAVQRNRRPCIPQIVIFPKA